jgi:hypothetical protein
MLLVGDRHTGNLYAFLPRLRQRGLVTEEQKGAGL